jgi:hypothetical protein
MMAEENLSYDVQQETVAVSLPAKAGLAVTDALWIMETETLEAMLADCDAAYASFEPPTSLGAIFGFGYSAPDKEAEAVGRMVAGELWVRAQREKRDALIEADTAARNAKQK